MSHQHVMEGGTRSRSAGKWRISAVASPMFATLHYRPSDNPRNRSPATALVSRNLGAESQHRLRGRLAS
jgi:hypothetical protein